jgi:gluconolactonase
MAIKPLPLSELRALGHGLLRPEDVAVTKDGRVFASDGHAAVSEIQSDGSRRPIGRAQNEPNGINVDPDNKSIVIANLSGNVLQRCFIDSGVVTTICDRVERRALRNPNYPIFSREGDLYCASSTQRNDIVEAMIYGISDGYLFRVRPNGSVDLLAEDLLLPNGLALDANEEFLYCCRTSAGDVVRFPILSDGTLGKQEVYGSVGRRSVWGEEAAATVWGNREHTFDNIDKSILREWGVTDGCAFDSEGNLWIACPGNGQIWAITPDGSLDLIVDDPSMSLLNQPTNVSFGGPDLRDVYFGTVGADYIVAGRSSVPGLPMAAQR